MRLAEKVAFISGGARGMGEVEARLFAKEGAKVAIGDVLEEDGRRVEGEINEAGGEALFLRLDVTSEPDWQRSIAATVSRFGRLDILVNNAGITPAFAALDESTLSDYADAIDDLVERVGIDHVGIGTDFCQDQPHSFFEWLFARQGTRRQPMPMSIANPHYHPQGFETPDKMPGLARELLGRGYSEDDVSKVLGGNWLRLFQQVWRG